MDRLKVVLLVAGMGFFLLAFALSGLYPYLVTDARRGEASIAEVARLVSPDFKALKDAYPVVFARSFPEAEQVLTERDLLEVPDDDPRRARSEEAWRRTFASALRGGRDIYVREACWHCHSQYVRPVANESTRFGPIQPHENDNNALQRPVLWGTRRVGPDLTHEGGLRSNDWHVAHFWDPRSTSPGSVMPSFRWFLRTGWAVARRIDPDIAALEGLPPDRSYRYPGIFDTRDEAEAELVRRREALPESLAAEKERLLVTAARGPNADGLAIIAYLQWLGTWRPDATEDD